MPQLEVNKYWSVAVSNSHTKVITDQTTWRDIKKIFESSETALWGLLTIFNNSPIIYISDCIITNYKVMRKKTFLAKRAVNA